MAFLSTNRDDQHKPYTYQAFPKYVEHATEPARVVPDEAAWIALGPGWGHPSDAEVPAVADEPDAPKKPRGRPRKDAA